jgi:DNA-binding transcriptional ArsR family regulator
VKTTRRKPVTDVDDPRYTKALSHPMRVRILAMLREAPASPVQLADRLPDASLGAIAYHVRTLHDLDLLELVATRQKRGATEHVYQAVVHPAVTAESWADLGPVAKQRLLTAMLQEVGESATTSAAAGGFDRSDAHITRTALKLDDRAWRQLASATKKWLRDVQRIEEAAQKRIQAKESIYATMDVALVLMLFEAVQFSAQRN